MDQKWIMPLGMLTVIFVLFCLMPLFLFTAGNKQKLLDNIPVANERKPALVSMSLFCDAGAWHGKVLADSIEVERGGICFKESSGMRRICSSCPWSYERDCENGG